MRAIVTTIPFGEIDPTPLKLLRDADIECVVNPLGRKLKPAEVPGAIDGYEIVIAGTETIGAEAMRSRALKAICRVGIGLDGVDLVEARRRGIAVSYTPEGPSAAVAELTIGQMIGLMRKTGMADRSLRQGRWERQFGGRLSLSTVGVVGCGRIGRRVIAHLLGGFPGVRILAHDIRKDLSFPGSDAVSWVDLSTLITESDIITLHVPLTQATRGMIARPELEMMRSGSLLLNTARGGVVDERALAEALQAGAIGGAAIDVFEEEPYSGPLTECDNVHLTCHMGSMTRDCRVRMEVEATKEAVRYAAGLPLLYPVPESEYELAGAAR